MFVSRTLVASHFLLFLLMLFPFFGSHRGKFLVLGVFRLLILPLLSLQLGCKKCLLPRIRLGGSCREQRGVERMEAREQGGEASVGGVRAGMDAVG